MRLTNKSDKRRTTMIGPVEAEDSVLVSRDQEAEAQRLADARPDIWSVSGADVKAADADEAPKPKASKKKSKK